MKRIVKIVEPDEKHGLYIVTFTDGKEEYTAHTNKEGLDVAKLEEKMEILGYDMKLVDDYRDAVITNYQRDQDMED